MVWFATKHTVCLLSSLHLTNQTPSVSYHTAMKHAVRIYCLPRPPPWKGAPCWNAGLGGPTCWMVMLATVAVRLMDLSMSAVMGST